MPLQPRCSAMQPWSVTGIVPRNTLTTPSHNAQPRICWRRVHRTCINALLSAGVILACLYHHRSLLARSGTVGLEGSYLYSHRQPYLRTRAQYGQT
ncbi:hypothetical protein P153DRAFT_178189 [Dothidotthia symphoricarpi CBS 119687]|uniref:Uncharacterized protein n=1 Tax=Dothidotthia symphoricarpi CBS 119687 TaxID=1392245 RepID=A0A6A6AMJ8_9PLEO|nr:uncharacterized protein P153DRAFT_178189 [Dothidotthia symphoricarpi CBS 119687]KAF2133010.1 hypothetical protein P153DRAFT_178189 [Dothidotthia symphoricarpi CBS 119687]